MVLANPALARVTLPVEVVGESGTTASVNIEVPAGRARQVRSLWMQIHNLAYPDMMSVQVNGSNWMSLNNHTVSIAEPGKSYGGISGGFSTLKVTLPLPGQIVVDGVNSIRFRFNGTDGLVSGFRVLAFNLKDSGEEPVLPADTFAEEDPNLWTPPLKDSNSISAGAALWQSAPLMANGLRDAPKIRAHCADCHTQDGRDLKYFSFSNASIAARSRFHGLSELQGQQIASYIRSLHYPCPGRPWNPPYQPGPGLDAQPVADWAAGAGVAWVLDEDNATLPYLFGGNVTASVTRKVFQPDGNLNARETPIAFQLPDWNHWLPQVHPLDAWGESFSSSEFYRMYGGAGSKTSLRGLLAAPDLGKRVSSGKVAGYFEKWQEARRMLLKPYVEGRNVNWSRALSVKAYSTQLWQLVKTWELTQAFQLEDRGRELFGETADARTWLNTIPAATAPATVNIPDGPVGMGGSALTNEYFDSSWYELQILLNSGNHRHRDRRPIDWVYVIGRFLDLYRESHHAEPARLLVAVIKSLQSTDPRLGPEDGAHGWRPRQGIDPTILISDTWAAQFQPLDAAVKRAITEGMLAAWLDKNQQYHLVRYFTSGLSERSYTPPASFGGIAGGKVWEAAPQFLAAGVSVVLVRQLERWGAAYEDVGARFQYEPGQQRRLH
jgi:hypothetical protein